MTLKVQMVFLTFEIFVPNLQIIMILKSSTGQKMRSDQLAHFNTNASQVANY